MSNIERKKTTAERILDAAERLFRKYSYPGLRMELLSEELGLSRKTLYNHFPEGKREIWTSCIQRRMADFADRLVAIVEDLRGEYVDRGGRILDIGREAVDVFYGPDGLISAGEDRVVFFPEIKTRYIKALTRFFGEGVDKGFLRADLPIRSLSEVLLVLIAAWGQKDSTLALGEVKSLPEFVQKVLFTGILSEAGKLQSVRLVQGGVDE